MAIIPKTRFLDYCMTVSYYAGIWPQIFENSTKAIRKWHKTRFHIVSTWFIIFHITQYAKLIELIVTGNMIQSELRNIFSLIPLYLTAILKGYKIQQNKTKLLLKDIVSAEKRILTSGDDEIITIYEEYVYLSKVLNLFFLIGGSIAIPFFLLAAYFKEPVIVKEENNTAIYKKLLAINAYTPFDDQKYYYQIFTWTGINGVYAGYYIIISDILIFSIISYGICQLRILQHILKNYNHYRRKIMTQLGCDENIASMKLFEECVIMHRNVIGYMDNFNSALSNVMLFEFIQSSIQLAFQTIDILTPDIVQCLFIGHFISTLLTKMFIYYRSAHELTIQSLNIAIAAYSGEWMDQPLEVKKNFVILMMRSQKHLKINIGPFFEMSLETYIMILKGTYSYIMAYTTCM